MTITTSFLFVKRFFQKAGLPISVRAGSVLAFVSLFATLVALPGVVRAQEADSPVEVTLTAFRIDTDDEGREKRVRTEEVAPGQIIEYVAEFRNRGEEELFNLKPMLPIPPTTSYLKGSARPREFETSLDGANFSKAPLKRDVVSADGSRREELVPVSEYRSLRWTTGSLKPGQSVLVRARVRVGEVEDTAGQE